jgi:hypothetical protein
MPFFWGTLMEKHGSVAGNPKLSSTVQLKNPYRYSYPGYSELLVGQVHDVQPFRYHKIIPLPGSKNKFKRTKQLHYIT